MATERKATDERLTGVQTDCEFGLDSKLQALKMKRVQTMAKAVRNKVKRDIGSF